MHTELTVHLVVQGGRPSLERAARRGIQGAGGETEAQAGSSPFPLPQTSISSSRQSWTSRTLLQGQNEPCLRMNMASSPQSQARTQHSRRGGIGKQTKLTRSLEGRFQRQPQLTSWQEDSQVQPPGHSGSICLYTSGFRINLMQALSDAGALYLTAPLCLCWGRKGWGSSRLSTYLADL